ncbi:hypothetical protein HK097_006573 [Rhizophlyctis rosea]|uniref:Outer dense fiber protein 3 n=1 Tax=Rhizophlyctis rosea TaxID=64517 RepID=A0AAD5X5P7_9FUNG|nr:hypothetical protein HK097_006573 [Rhizophlyctis rosea]
MDTTPSPFTYSDTHNMLGKDAVSYSISGWAKTWANESPGPDRYNLRAGSGGGPKYCFGLKTHAIEDETPGPLDYNAPFILPDAPTAPSFSFRPNVGDELFEDKETDFRPAPNTYFPKMKWGEKAATLKGHYKESKAMKTPGPANYIVPANLFNGPQFSMTGREIPYEEEDYYIPTPGPTSYSPKTNLTNDKAPAFSMQARRSSGVEKALRKQNSPGPGSYTPRDRQVRGNDGQKATLKSRWKDRTESTPGPASYAPTTMIPPAGTMSRKPPTNVPERIKYHIDGTPGPTDYTPSISAAKPHGPRYTLGKRLKIEKADTTPGPNAYKPPSSITKDGRITMKSRMSPFVMVFPTTRVDTIRV